MTHSIIIFLYINIFFEIVFCVYKADRIENRIIIRYDNSEPILKTSFNNKQIMELVGTALGFKNYHVLNPDEFNKEKDQLSYNAPIVEVKTGSKKKLFKFKTIYNPKTNKVVVLNVVKWGPGNKPEIFSLKGDEVYTLEPFLQSNLFRPNGTQAEDNTTSEDAELSTEPTKTSAQQHKKKLQKAWSLEAVINAILDVMVKPNSSKRVKHIKKYQKRKRKTKKKTKTGEVSFLVELPEPESVSPKEMVYSDFGKVPFSTVLNT